MAKSKTSVMFWVVLGLALALEAALVLRARRSRGPRPGGSPLKPPALPPGLTPAQGALFRDLLGHPEAFDLANWRMVERSILNLPPVWQLFATHLVTSEGEPMLLAHLLENEFELWKQVVGRSALQTLNLSSFGRV